MAWHVGDCIDTDVAGANAAGITSVWLNRRATGTHPTAIPTFEIETLDALPALWADLYR